MTLKAAVERNESGRLNSSPIPANAIQKQYQTHNSIRIPAPDRLPIEKEDLVAISVLDEFAQAAFPVCLFLW